MGRKIVRIDSYLIELRQLSKSMNSCLVHVITGGTQFHQAISSTFSSDTVQLSDFGVELVTT